MTVSLTNTSGRCLVFVLPHEGYCDAVGRCVCGPPARRDGGPVASSLTLPSASVAGPLGDAVLGLPDVVRAVRRGDVTVTRHVPEPPRPSIPSTPKKRGSG